MEVYEKIIELIDNPTKSIFSNKSLLWKQIIYKSHKGKKNNLSQVILKKSNFLRDCGCMPDYSESERQIYIDRFRSILSNKNIPKLNYPEFGDPKYLIVDGHKIPLSHFYKLSSLFYIIEALEIEGREKKNLKCAEIGAGWGCLASLLIEQSYLSSYTDIDLPETLSLAAFYLTRNFPNLDSILQTKTKTNPAFFTFSTPEFVNYIDEKYDLIINEASIAEMTRETASAYLDWIQNHLNKNGIFIWQNGRSRGKSDATVKMADYDLARFKPILLKPQRGKASFQHGAALFIAAKLKDEEAIDDKKLNFYYDVITQLCEIGITDDIISIYENLPKNKLSLNQIKYIEAIDSFFDSKNLESATKFCNSPNNDESLITSIYYLIGIKKFLDGNIKDSKINLDEYLEHGRSPLALAFCAAIYSANKWVINEESPISYLKKKLNNDYHWPEYIKRENFNSKKLKQILERKSFYPWKIQKKHKILIFRKAKKIFNLFR